MTNFRRRALWILFGFLGFFLILVIFANAMIGWYLRSDRFRRQLGTSVGGALEAEGTFTPFQYTGGTFYCDGFTARGGPNAFFSKLRADQIRALFNWRGMLDRRWQIDELTVQSVDLQFAERKGGSAAPTGDGKINAASPPNYNIERRSARSTTTWKLDLRKASIARSSWRWDSTLTTNGITGAAFTLEPNGASWIITANSGKVSQSGWPDLSIESARLRYNSSSLFINESSLRTGTGHVAVTGEVKFDQAADVKAQFEDLPIAPLLAADWRLRLTGKIAGNTTIHLPLPNGAMHVEGEVRLVDGQLEALPLLDQIATFTRTERFRRVTLTRGSLNFSRDAGFVTAKDIVLESEGLMRVEGACTIMNEQIDGVFQIGVTASSLQWLPGSQSRVFTIAHDGYFWTPLRLTGPAAHPNEDLTQRLVAAAAGELLQNTQDTVRDTAKSLLDLLPR